MMDVMNIQKPVSRKGSNSPSPFKTSSATTSSAIQYLIYATNIKSEISTSTASAQVRKTDEDMNDLPGAEPKEPPR
jgi:hypothetical protein